MIKITVKTLPTLFTLLAAQHSCAFTLEGDSLSNFVENVRNAQYLFGDISYVAVHLPLTQDDQLVEAVEAMEKHQDFLLLFEEPTAFNQTCEERILVVADLERSLQLRQWRLAKLCHAWLILLDDSEAEADLGNMFLATLDSRLFSLNSISGLVSEHYMVGNHC